MKQKIKSNQKYILSIMFIFSYMLLVFSQQKTVDDFIWHIKIGEDICKLGTLPGEIYSWISEIIPLKTMWHEWLSEVIMFKLYSIGDTIGNIYYSILLLCIAMAIVLLNKDIISKANTQTLITASVFLAMGLTGMVYPRPYLFGILFFIIETTCLRRFNNCGEIKWVIPIPFITILWANTHGGTILFSVVIPLGYFVCSLLKFSLGNMDFPQKSLKQKISFAVLTILNVIASCINPYGISLLLYPFTYNTSDCKKYVKEWFPVTLSNSMIIIIFILLMFLLLIRKKRLDAPTFGITVAFILLTCRYIRFEMWSAIVMFPLFLELDLPKLTNKRYKKYIKIFALSILSCFVIFSIKDAILNKTKQQTISIEMRNQIIALAPQRIYNGYNAGGDLISIGVKDFVDARADPFSAKNIIKDEFDFELGNMTDEEMDNYILKWNFDAFLVQNNDYVIKHLEKTGKYKTLYSDDRYTLLIPENTY